LVEVLQAQVEVQLVIVHENGAEHQDQQDREHGREEHGRLLAVEALETHHQIAPTTRRFIVPPCPRRRLVERLAGELQKNLFEVGFANVHAEKRRPGVFHGVQYFPDIIGVRHPHQ
jgi:hypothetical protein